MYEHIKREMAQGHGIYIVCPFVDTSDKMVTLPARQPVSQPACLLLAGCCLPSAASRLLACLLTSGNYASTLPSPPASHPAPCPLCPCAHPCLPCEQEEIKAATAELERLVAEGVFEAQDCGLLHGQMPPEQKDAVLQQFKEGHIKVLVRWAGRRGWAGGRAAVCRPLAALAAERQASKGGTAPSRTGRAIRLIAAATLPSAVCAAPLWLRWEWMWRMPL
jgi:hypothetical protein